MGTREVYEEKLRRGNLHHDPTLKPGLGSARCPRCLSLLNPTKENSEWKIAPVLHDATAVCDNSDREAGVITFDGKVVHGSNFFRYLGSIIQKDGEIDGDVAHRIKAGWLKWKSATGVLCDPDMPHRLKGKFYRTAIRPTLLYGTECWAVKQCHIQKMNVAEMRMLRWMCGHTKKDRLRNEVIREKVRVASIEDKMMENRLRWFGHVRRRPVDAPVRRLESWGTSNIVKGRGRPKKTWIKLIENDMRFLGIGESMAGSGLGGMLSAVHGFNTGIPYFQKNVKGPKWLPFVIGLPPLLIFTAASAAFGGYAFPKFTQLTVASYYATSSASHYGISLITRHIEEDHISRIQQKELR
ncbi:hypothetical protein OROMI_031648 [Orobanche minor]